MKSIAVALVALLFALASQVQAPKPAPELKAMEPWIGNWTIEAQAKDAPSEPEYKLTWTLQCRWILGGFFLESRHTQKSPRGETTFLEIYGYDPIRKDYISRGFASNGSTFTATGTFKDEVTVITAPFVSAEGKSIMKYRNTFTLSPDRMSLSLKGEQEKDGTWWTSMTGKGVKTKAAPKGQ
jgi:hypothetical protein